MVVSINMSDMVEPLLLRPVYEHLCASTPIVWQIKHEAWDDDAFTLIGEVLVRGYNLRVVVEFQDEGVLIAPNDDAMDEYEPAVPVFLPYCDPSFQDQLVEHCFRMMSEASAMDSESELPGSLPCLARLRHPALPARLPPSQGNRRRSSRTTPNLHPPTAGPHSARDGSGETDSVPPLQEHTGERE